MRSVYIASVEAIVITKRTKAYELSGRLESLPLNNYYTQVRHNIPVTLNEDGSMYDDPILQSIIRRNFNKEKPQNVIIKRVFNQKFSSLCSY